MRNSIATIAAVSALALVPLLGGAATATAESSGEVGVLSDCPSDGYITRWDRCTTLSNGIIIVNTDTNGDYIKTQYHKTGGSTVTAKLGYLRSGTNHWATSRSMSAGMWYENSWSVSASCSVVNGLLYSGGTTYQTPAADPC
ncbi:hypothetical protein [Streptomyces sp. NPDC056192]|uniref:hypothetical protein n=1 Tax=Streptomyces sp. NPDC056192 TaxID=3345743 RepID=UPI0035D96504